ncbi:MAG: trypsin-like peptidase domain-containing protein [Patescibacteria group bacterium]
MKNDIKNNVKIAGVIILLAGLALMVYDISTAQDLQTQNTEESQTINVVKQDAPAVVSILASQNVSSVQQCGLDFPASLQAQCLETSAGASTTLQRIGAGSGFLVSADGFIVTNKHVVDTIGAVYTVILNDSAHAGQEVKARVVATDPSNDIAILKIDNISGLPFLTFGNSDNLQVGQTAISIGYALGQFNNSVSKGVVSGLMRNVTAQGDNPLQTEDLHGVIQTDAAINPGNSGGPLLDIAGNVIGMNVATADAPGIGFALPGNLVKRDLDQVISGGQLSDFKIPFIGVRYEPVTIELQTNMNLPYSYGMLVIKGDRANQPAVAPGSPAAQAGIKAGDIILTADGKQLNENYLLSDVVNQHNVGDTIELQIYRNGQTLDVSVVLAGK